VAKSPSLQVRSGTRESAATVRFTAQVEAKGPNSHPSAPACCGASRSAENSWSAGTEDVGRLARRGGVVARLQPLDQHRLEQEGFRLGVVEMISRCRVWSTMRKDGGPTGLRRGQQLDPVAGCAPCRRKAPPGRHRACDTRPAPAAGATGCGSGPRRKVSRRLPGVFTAAHDKPPAPLPVACCNVEVSAAKCRSGVGLETPWRSEGSSA
jgi:hypothetical protein